MDVSLDDGDNGWCFISTSLFSNWDQLLRNQTWLCNCVAYLSPQIRKPILVDTSTCHIWQFVEQLGNLKQNMFKQRCVHLSLFIQTWSNCLPRNFVVLATPITEEKADQGSADHSVCEEKFEVWLCKADWTLVLCLKCTLLPQWWSVILLWGQKPPLSPRHTGEI